MTGPVERVPLTDEQLDRIEYMARFPARWRESLSNAAPHLVAELRASRAREQAQRTLREHAEHVKIELRDERDELQQRIDKALARIDKAEPRQWRRVAVMRDIHAALTGTET